MSTRYNCWHAQSHRCVHDGGIDYVCGYVVLFVGQHTWKYKRKSMKKNGIYEWRSKNCFTANVVGIYEPAIRIVWNSRGNLERRKGSNECNWVMVLSFTHVTAFNNFSLVYSNANDVMSFGSISFWKFLNFVIFLLSAGFSRVARTLYTNLFE